MTNKKPKKTYPTYLKGQGCRINGEWKFVDVDAKGIDQLLKAHPTKKSDKLEYSDASFMRSGCKNLEESLLVEYAESLKCRAYDLLDFAYGGEFCKHDDNYQAKAIDTLYDAGLITDSDEVEY